MHRNANQRITAILFHNVGGLEFGVPLELVQPEVGELDDPARVHQAVRRAEGAVELYDRIVKVNHALWNNERTNLWYF